MRIFCFGIWILELDWIGLGVGSTMFEKTCGILEENSWVWTLRETADNKVTKMADTISLVIKWAGKEIPLDDICVTSTVGDLKRVIEEKTSVLPGRQKLLNLKYKGKTIFGLALYCNLIIQSFKLIRQTSNRWSNPVLPYAKNWNKNYDDGILGTGYLTYLILLRKHKVNASFVWLFSGH